MPDKPELRRWVIVTHHQGVVKVTATSRVHCDSGALIFYDDRYPVDKNIVTHFKPGEWKTCLPNNIKEPMSHDEAYVDVNGAAV